MRTLKIEAAALTIEAICEFYGMDIEYVKHQISLTECVGWGEQHRLEEAFELAVQNGLRYDEQEGLQDGIYSLKTGYSNHRWTKGHCKMAIKLFKVMVDGKCKLHPKGKIKVGKCFHTGGDIYSTNSEMIKAFVRRGIVTVKFGYKSSMANDGTYGDSELSIELTELGKSVFDNELSAEISRVSQMGMEFYFQAMDMVKVYLSFFKVNAKGIPQYKA